MEDETMFDSKLKKLLKKWDLPFVRVKRANTGSSQLSGNVMHKTKVPERRTGEFRKET
jgi:hypothetical protein